MIRKGPKLVSHLQNAMLADVGLGSIASVLGYSRNVRFIPR